MRLTLINWRASFPKFFTPEAREEGQAKKYSGTFIAGEDSKIQIKKGDETKVFTFDQFEAFFKKAIAKLLIS